MFTSSAPFFSLLPPPLPPPKAEVTFSLKFYVYEAFRGKKTQKNPTESLSPPQTKQHALFPAVSTLN